MKPAAFGYHRPDALSECLELLGQPGSRVLAGGQSLVPLLNRRALRPRRLVDITRIADLAGVTISPGRLRVGATTTHQALVVAAAGAGFPGLSRAGAGIGQLPVRLRGTVGGSLAHADPAAEWCAAAAVFDARITLASTHGVREVSATDFFTGPSRTACEAHELVVAVEFARPWTHAATVKHGHAGSVMCLSVGLQVDRSAEVSEARVVVGGGRRSPARVTRLEELLTGRPVGDLTSLARAVDAGWDRGPAAGGVAVPGWMVVDVVHDALGLRAREV